VRNKRRSITECNLDPLEGTLRYCRSGFRTDLDLLIRHVYIYINAFPDIGFSNRATVFCLRLERILIVRINILYEDAMHTRSGMRYRIILPSLRPLAVFIAPTLSDVIKNIAPRGSKLGISCGCLKVHSGGIDNGGFNTPVFRRGREARAMQKEASQDGDIRCAVRSRR